MKQRSFSIQWSKEKIIAGLKLRSKRAEAFEDQYVVSRMVKMVVQRGHNERGGDAYSGMLSLKVK